MDPVLDKKTADGGRFDGPGESQGESRCGINQAGDRGRSNDTACMCNRALPRAAQR